MMFYYDINNDYISKQKESPKRSIQTISCNNIGKPIIHY